ncbi:hypothetical protein EDB80DRAFT_690892 [Ilyonectria destructans]|nr:hypothetical protein EDB80DRAFT_690892 [Ilyonectria destructans]
MTYLTLTVTLATLAASVSACASHKALPLAIKKRVETEPMAEWVYEASFNWGCLDPEYTICQTGIQQLSIPLSLSNRLILNYQLNLDYPDSINSIYFNWGYGPVFTVAYEDSVWTDNPAVTYNNKMVYLAGWHVHTPADYSVGGDCSKVEMYFVYVDAEGYKKAVLAFCLNSGNSNNIFFS